MQLRSQKRKERIRQPLVAHVICTCFGSSTIKFNTRTPSDRVRRKEDIDLSYV